MKIGLVTTSIAVPTILSLYRQYGPDVGFFVAGDRKTPDDLVLNFFQKQTGTFSYSNIDTQHALYKSSKLFGENTIQRRVFALLAALEWGADIIVSVDTDDFPTRPDHFFNITEAFRVPFNGLELRANSGWVDPGSLIEPPTPHRGMPVRLDRFYVHPAIDRKVGVVASTVLGSCDLAAIDRLVGTPKRSVASELARSGVIVDPARSWTIFNSEAVAYCRELAPAMMVLPFVQRYDDLYASLVTQRVMREHGYVTRLGPPAVWHEREDRDILNDLKNEIYGMENIKSFATCLDAIDLGAIPCLAGGPPLTVLDEVRHIWSTILMEKILPPQTIEAALAFLEDMESIL